MSEENTSVEIPASGEDFNDAFFGKKEVKVEVTEPVEPVKTDAPTEDTIEDTDTLATEPDDDTTESDEGDETDLEEESEGDKPDPKPKKNRFQDRIDELTARAKEAERREQAAAARMEALEARLQKEVPTAQSARERIESAIESVDSQSPPVPMPDDQYDDGTDKYPLGEFDPKYIRDLTKHALATETVKMEQRRLEEQATYERDKQRNELQKDWETKLGPAQERYPDFKEKGEKLVSVFSTIDASYGEYLTATLMSMEYGPDVLYYLANNTDEAKKIVDSGPTKATVTLGRLEAKFADASEIKQKARPKVSKAPEPPTHMNKGSSVSKSDNDLDLDDLDAVSRALFKNVIKRQNSYLKE